MQKEIWKDVVNYEGLYQVSNLGRVKSLERRVYNRNVLRLIKGVILSQSNSSNGRYFKVSLHKDGIQSTRQVHQLVAIAFLGHIPCGYKLVVNHIDFDTHNNIVENLEIISQRENANQKHIKTSSDHVGVHWSKSNNVWHSGIRIDGNYKHLGCFKNELDAAMAYKNYRIENNIK